MSELFGLNSWIDAVGGAVLLLALVRGARAGLLREGLSLTTLALCTIMTRLFAVPVAARLSAWTGGELAGRTSVWVGGLLVLGTTFTVCRFAARRLRRDLPDGPLRWNDRLGGGLLGLAEGAVATTAVLVLGLSLFGTDHPSFEGARSLALLEDARDRLPGGERPLPDVAAARRDWLRDR